jgi:uncharacterized delta-60 repeat protein
VSVRLPVGALAAAALAVLCSASPAAAAPGQLDPTFGSGGIVHLLPTHEEATLRGVAVQPDGKVVLAGAEAPGNLLLFRLLPNGEMDPSFGSGGEVVTTLPGGAEARAVAIQPDGKIVAVGSGKGPVNFDFLFARYLANGALDPSFGGGDGLATVPVGTESSRALAAAIGADGRIAAVGEAKNGAETVAGVAVVLPDGTPDPAFAGGATTIETSVGNDRGKAVALLPDGRLLIGDANGAGGGYGFTLVQLLPTGAPDPSFGGGDGTVMTPIPGGNPTGGGGRIADLARLPDGRIVAAGYGENDLETPPSDDSKFAAARYLADGELDPSFADGGIFTRQLSGLDDQAVTIDLAEGGKLLVAGIYEEPASMESEPAVLRLGAAGSLDPAFGAGGIVLRGQTAPFGEGVNGSAVDSQDRLVTVGMAYLGNEATEVRVTRYLGDRQPEPPATGAPPSSQPQAVDRAPHARMRKVPRKIAARRLKGFSGSAADPDGDALRVQVALVRLVRGGARAARRTAPVCFQLKDAKAHFRRVRVRKGGRCPQRWLAAAGTTKWSFRLKRRLPPGRYVVYARAVDARGLAEAEFSRGAGNRYAFRVLRSR